MAPELDTLVNLRDVGGLPITGGGVTRSGILYRGDAFWPGDRRPETVAQWPPAVVIDLRSDAEVERVRYGWEPESEFLHHPIHERAVPTDLREQGELADLYTFLLDHAGHRLAAVVNIVGEDLNGPALVHCAAGKDRTGLVVAALLLAADVAPEAVVADYVATAQNMDRLVERWANRARAAGREIRADQDGVRPNWLLAPEEAITVAVERFVDAPGGTRGWLADHGADPARIEAWRQRIASDA